MRKFQQLATALLFVLGLPLYCYIKAPSSICEREDLKARLRGPLKGSDQKVVEVLQKSYLFPPSDLPYSLSSDSNYKLHSKGNSWEYINYYLKEFFSGEKGGFFVEAGALDGEFLSNTLWLEMNLNWTGLLIEPNIDSFNYLQTKHRRAWSSNTCLSNDAYPKEVVLVNTKLNRKYEGIDWNHRGMSHEYGINILPRNSPVLLQNDNKYSVVQCFPLITYLKAFNVSTVDFLSLDIQGGEKNVLRNFPWEDVKVRVIVAEISEKTRDFKFIKFMEDKGYVLISKTSHNLLDDQIYFRKEEPRLKYLPEVSVVNFEWP